MLETASRERPADAAGQQMTQTGMCEAGSSEASFGVIGTRAETARAGVRSRPAEPELTSNRRVVRRRRAQRGFGATAFAGES